MIPLAIDKNRSILVGLFGSMLIHVVLFSFSGKTFIPHAQYSVQPSVQTVEISIEETGNTSVVMDSPKGAAMSIKGEARSMKSTSLKKTSHKDRNSAHCVTGVKLKANPDYFQNPPPEYPELAKQMRQEGLVLLVVDVDRDGMPIKVEIKQSSGHRLLDQAAFKAVSHWKFQPGSIGNIPIESTVTVPIRFRIEK